MVDRTINNFYETLHEINTGIVEGYVDEMTEKLVYAIDYYEDNHLHVSFSNIFDKASNVIEAVSKRALLLEQLRRIIDLAKDRDDVPTLGIYYRYYALAQSFYGEPKRGMKIIEEAERILDKDTGEYIELRNAKALILAEMRAFEESLETFELNFEESKRINYKPGYRFLHNIGTAYRDLGALSKAADYITKGIEYDLELDYTLNAVTAMVELADVYLKAEDYDKAFETLHRVSKYDVLMQNTYLYKTYCEVKYQLLKDVGDFEEALNYHEILMNLELQLNMDKYSGMIDDSNIRHDLTEKERENEIIKRKNNNLQLMSQRLENTNKFLQTTLKQSKEMQEALKMKNEELESTMQSLNLTQEKLVTAEKQSVMDEMFINIAEHMSTPLGVMTTSISHHQKTLKQLRHKFETNHLSKHDLVESLEEGEQTIGLLNSALDQVVGFIDTLRLYKNNDEEEVTEIDLSEYLSDLKNDYVQFKGVNDIHIDCHANQKMLVNVSLLTKCLDLVCKKLLSHTSRNGFDIEVTQEINILTIGIGDFKTETEPEAQGEASIVDTYDYYIVESIVENLLGGRFIKFKDKGRDFYQFIFQLG